MIYSTATSPAARETAYGLLLGAEVVIGLGGVGVLAVFISLLVYLLRKLRKTDRQDGVSSNGYVMEGIERRCISRAN